MLQVGPLHGQSPAAVRHVIVRGPISARLRALLDSWFRQRHWAKTPGVIRMLWAANNRGSTVLWAGILPRWSVVATKP